MKGLIDVLRDTSQSPCRYVLSAALISVIPSLIISSFVDLIFEPEPIPIFDTSAGSLLFGAVLIGPWLETLLMIPVFWILKLCIHGTLKTAVISALIWAFLHSLVSPVWGLAIGWAFFVFSLSFLEWRRESLFKAIQVTALIHMSQNLLAAILILVIRATVGE